MKLVAFAAGNTHDVCWFTALGDYLALCREDARPAEQPEWLLPFLRGTSSPGTVVGTYLKAQPQP